MALPQPPDLGVDGVARLLSQEKYAEARILLEGEVKENPSAPQPHYLLSLILLKLKNPLEARTELEYLKTLPDSKELRHYISNLEPLVPPLPLTVQEYETLSSKLQHYDAGQASLVIDGFSLPGYQKEILKLYIELYGARFASALSRLQRITTSSLISPSNGQRLGNEIRQMASEYKEFADRLNRFAYSPLASSSCTPQSARASNQSQSFMRSM
jgi:hypothetical protein